MENVTKDKIDHIESPYLWMHQRVFVVSQEFAAWVAIDQYHWLKYTDSKKKYVCEEVFPFYSKTMRVQTKIISIRPLKFLISYSFSKFRSITIAFCKILVGKLRYILSNYHTITGLQESPWAQFFQYLNVVKSYNSWKLVVK